jgi:hypothetical protein
MGTILRLRIQDADRCICISQNFKDRRARAVTVSNKDARQMTGNGYERVYRAVCHRHEMAALRTS